MWSKGFIAGQMQRRISAGFLPLLLAFLLLVRIPYLFAVGANNLASWMLLSEWGEVGRQISLAQCGEASVDSSAARYLTAARSVAPDYGRALVNAGRVDWLLGDCVEAGEKWQRALVVQPGDETTAFWLLWVSGIDYADRVTEGLPTEIAVKLTYQAGERAGRTENADTASAWYKLSMDLKPSLEAASALVQLHRQAGRQEDAIAVWQQLAVGLPEEDPDHWWALGMAAELAGEWEMAAAAYGEGEARTDDAYDFLMRQGDTYRRVQRWGEAEKVYRQTLMGWPENPWPYLNVGHVRLAQEDHQGARRWYEMAWILAPDDPRPAYYLGLTDFRQERYREARGWLEAALQADPGHVWSVYYLAQTAYQLGETSQAAGLLAQAVDMHTGEPWAWSVQLGDWRLELGDREGALEAYQRALEWMPSEATIEARIQQVLEQGN
jgi:tetratricopeptide (TPR) repeat protein